jgi:hypothetical protein
MKKKNVYSTFIIAILLVFSGCIGVSGLRFGRSELKSGINPDELYPGWAKTDRCTKCHMAWTWEYGYYRGWDRHGLISDFSEVSPTGYKDPYGLDVPFNTFEQYYYTSWWQGDWLNDQPSAYPPMNFDGYGRINDVTASPKDFRGTVIVVDPNGKGDAVSVQEGVDLSKSGDTVFVKAGTYKESIRLREGLRLWGEDAFTTIIDSENKASGIIAANNCDISGFTITGTGFDYSEDRFRAAIHAIDCDSTLVIRGNLFFSNSVFGVLVESSRSDGYITNSEDRYITPEKALENLEYSGYPNPRIIGNTFYNIGERAIYCIHSSPEIANNIFMGNLKTLGMTQLSKPFIHHNVFYRNTVSININRSMPVISHNIMYNNVWGQRIMEGSHPVIHNNVTWNSPYYNEFGEDGKHLIYDPIPGTGEREADPQFIDSDGGDFNFSSASVFYRQNTGMDGYGILTGDGIQVPPAIACKYSWADEFLHKTVETDAIISALDTQNQQLKSLDVAYSVEYRSFMTADYDSAGNQVSVSISPEPVSGTSYDVSRMLIADGKRQKHYKSVQFYGEKAVDDSGTVVFDGKIVRALSGRFKTDYPDQELTYSVGELPMRENIGGLYYDYDQYLNGAIGPGGTFYFGYLRILGGEALPEREMIDGHECVVVRYPHLGSDQVYKFFLDPEINYRPRRLEQYFERNLFRRIDDFVYTSYNGIFLPVAATITDYAVKEPNLGKVIGLTTMRVDPSHFIVNGEELLMSGLVPAQIDFIDRAKNGTWVRPPKVSKRKKK